MIIKIPVSIMTPEVEFDHEREGYNPMALREVKLTDEQILAIGDRYAELKAELKENKE